MLSKQTALQIIAEVLTAIKDWRSLAIRLGTVKREQDQFSATFERQIRLYVPQLYRS